jgi:hypothetical protein
MISPEPDFWIHTVSVKLFLIQDVYLKSHYLIGCGTSQNTEASASKQIEGKV